MSDIIVTASITVMAPEEHDNSAEDAIRLAEVVIRDRLRDLLWDEILVDGVRTDAPPVRMCRPDETWNTK